METKPKCEVHPNCEFQGEGEHTGCKYHGVIDACVTVGRPLKFQNAGELEAKISEYFLVTPKEEWTITGLALALDTSRKVLVEYEDRDKFSNAIKKAKLKVENGYEVDLKKHGRSGTIFALKNFDWKDKTEQEVNVKGTLSSLFDKARDE